MNFSSSNSSNARSSRGNWETRSSNKYKQWKGGEESEPQYSQCYDRESRFFNINDLIKITKFNRSEIQLIYRDFKQVNSLLFKN